MASRFARFLRKHSCVLLLLTLVTPVGFLTKAYGGPGAGWVQNSLGGVLYVIFWTLLFSLPFHRSKPWKVALPVLFVTCALEALQLWHPPLLEAVRGTFLGHALLGNTFSWSDMLHYLGGFLVSLILLHICRRNGRH